MENTTNTEGPLKIGDTVKGNYYGVDFEGQITSFDMSGLCIDCKITVYDVERDGIWISHQERAECRITKTANAPEGIRCATDAIGFTYKVTA